MIFDLLPFLSEFGLKKSTRTEYSGDSQIAPYQWLEEKLPHTKILKLASGELSISIRKKHEEAAKMVKESLLKGTIFEIICGPEIWVNENRINELFRLLDWEEEARKNLKVWIPKKRLPFHFVITDNDVLVERAHLRSDNEAPFFVIENSVVWRKRLTKYFNSLKGECDPITTAENYPQLYTSEELLKKDEMEFGSIMLERDK